MVSRVIPIEAWQFRQAGLGSWMPAQVPGVVHSDLMANGAIEDPFYRLNEHDQQWVDKVNWEYRAVITLDETDLSEENLDLVCHGLDSYCYVYVNGHIVLSANNMFRTWRVAVRDHLRVGDNSLHIIFHSPVQEGLAQQEAFGLRLPAANDLSEIGGLGHNRISMFTRKAGYHYGWDWGPRLTTSGIWRPVELHAWSNARLKDVYVRQDKVNNQIAELTAEVTIHASANIALDVQVICQSHGANVSIQRQVDIDTSVYALEIPISIENPKLWWSNGLGKPDMYNFRVELSCNGELLQAQEIKTGLRSLRLVRNADSDGETFLFELNGIPVFAKGANYIPNDNLLPRVTPERYRKVIADAANANMNMIRVWGGGVYENEIFYNLCDENGIMVWHDFMFACALYPGEPEFIENVKQEAIDNVIRLRNHPCMALWCGNNEINWGWQYYGEDKWGWKKDYEPEQQLRLNAQYEQLFHSVLPSIVGAYTNTCYWPSSPMSGPEPADHASYENASGDMHYWGVWHDLHPFESFEKYVGRFMSEYGFQSFPEFETVKRFSVPADWDIESEVMASHQRSGIGNLRIKEYMASEYNVPDDFEQFIYISQVLQARSIRMAIEAHRRAMPFCMGSLYWQLNDCWPVASWSSTDYYHNWKALHYAVRKAYEPVIISTREQDNELEVYVVSDLLQAYQANLRVEVRDFNGELINSHSQQVTVDPNTSSLVHTNSITDLTAGSSRRQVYVSISLTGDELDTVGTVVYLAKAKDLELPEPKFAIDAVDTKNGVELIVSGKVLARDVMLYIPGQQVFFQSNYIDILPGVEYRVAVDTELSSQEVADAIRWRHLLIV